MLPPLLPPQDERRRFRGFTLIELLVVLVVISLLVALVMPGLLGTLAASRITQGGDTMAGFLSEAQSRAFGQSRPVEVRFYRVPGVEDALEGAPAGGFFRGGLLLEYYQPGEIDPRNGTSALGETLAVVQQAMLVLPDGTALSDHAEMSTLMVGAAPTGSEGVETVTKTPQGYQTFTPPSSDYRSFVQYPETTSLDPGSRWHISVVAAPEASLPPAQVTNFYTLLIDPVTTRITAYRP